jgi:predicted lipoprotein with Yx(FWY)xxD motif
MKTTTIYATLLALAAAVVLALAACGGGGDSSAGGSTSGGGSAPMVSTKTVDGVGPVLVDAEGMALYAADQEAGGKVLCTGSCTSIWEPLTVSGGMPTAGDGVSGKLGVTNRPDGDRQVTFDGRLLYRFAEDEDAGTVTGNGAADSFDGHSFTWHVATPTGISMSKANSSSSGDDDSGYGY